MMGIPQLPPEVDLARPSAARIYDYMLGGSNNFPVDREAAAKLQDVVPEFHEIAWANRGFHQRAARWIASQGIGQFIDLGSALPTVGNTHEVVREVLPTARVVYVDMDPLVAVCAAALNGDDAAAFIQADLRDPAPLLDHPGLRRLIDFSQPVGLVMTAVLHFVADGSDPWAWWASTWARWPRAATWRCPTPPRSGYRRSRYSAGRTYTPTRRCSCTCGPGPRSAGSSPGWTWCPRTTGPGPR